MKTRTIAVMALFLCGHTVAGQLQMGLVAESHVSTIQDKKTEVALVPAVNYQGERFSFVGGELSYAFYQQDGYRLSILGQRRGEGYEVKDSSALESMEDRESGFDLGLGITTTALWGEIKVNVLADITGRSGGQEIKAAYRYPLQAGRWIFESLLGVSWKSAELVDYYYGVSQKEARFGRPGYLGDAAINPYATFNLVYKLDREWLLVGGCEITLLDDSIADSPIIDRNNQLNLYSAVL